MQKKMLFFPFLSRCFSKKRPFEEVLTLSFYVGNERLFIADFKNSRIFREFFGKVLIIFVQDLLATLLILHLLGYQMGRSVRDLFLLSFHLDGVGRAETYWQSLQAFL